MVIGNNCIDLCLLEHKLRQQDAIGIVCLPPWQIAFVFAIPGQKIGSDLCFEIQAGHKSRFLCNFAGVLLDDILRTGRDQIANRQDNKHDVISQSDMGKNCLWDNIKRRKPV